MNEGRMPACNVEPLAGSHIASARDVPNGHNNNKNSTSTQPLIGGNRCGHDKNNLKKPTFYGSAGDKTKRSHAIKRSCAIIEDIIGFKFSRNGRKKFVQLCCEGDRDARSLLELFENKELAKLFYHSSETKMFSRLVRSELVESSYALVARTLINGIDLRTMAFGYWDHKTNKQSYFDYGYLLSKTRLTPTRLLRAIAFLKKKGLIEVNRVVKTLDDGRIIHKQTQIFISEKIFNLLGLTKEMLEDRRYAMIKWEKERSKNYSREKYLETFRPAVKKIAKVDNKFSKVVNQVTKGCQSLAGNFSLPPARSKGNHEDIMRKVNALVREGMSPADALESVRKSRSPPH